ncbi:hypothetical protein AKA01nite_04850 [Alkalibacterium kapii]|uniref:Uncharacterized protein n=1 Tax=Alkalibacterium kapii TaxID=426704 RepID=A0A511AU48_9LACT|nr:hypothetical protein AKA01nite_04850 [Alkalibacterium kapii]
MDKLTTIKDEPNPKVIMTATIPPIVFATSLFLKVENDLLTEGCIEATTEIPASERESSIPNKDAIAKAQKTAKLVLKVLAPIFISISHNFLHSFLYHVLYYKSLVFNKLMINI